MRADLENGGDLALLHALPHQRLVAARAQSQRKGVKQDRLAGAGLAGEHGKPVGEIDIEPVDQDNVADRKSGEHAAGNPVRRLADLLSLKTRMAGTRLVLGPATGRTRVPATVLWIDGSSPVSP